MTAIHICVDCNLQAPKTDDSFTLISSQFGWRLEIEQGDDGKRLPVWRCPKCWQRHRDQIRASAVMTRLGGKRTGS